MIEYTVHIQPHAPYDARFYQIGIFGDAGAQTKYRIRHENAVFYCLSDGIVPPEIVRARVRAFVAGVGVKRSFQEIWDKGF